MTNDPCDDWSGIPIPHKPSVEPALSGDTSGLDDMRVHRALYYGEPVDENSGDHIGSSIVGAITLLRCRLSLHREGRP